MRGRRKYLPPRIWVGRAFAWRGYEPPNPVNYTTLQRETFVYDERIFDVEHGIGANNPCRHEVQSYTDMGMNGAVSYDWNHVEAYGPSQFTSNDFPFLPEVSGAKMSSYARQLVEQWTNNPPPEINMAENLAELKQTFGIPGQIRKLARSLAFARSHKGIDQALRKFSALGVSSKRQQASAWGAVLEVVRNAPSTFSDAFLLWEFGIAPLLSDISKLPGLVDRTVSRLERLNSANNKWKRHSITRSDVESFTPDAIRLSSGFHEFWTRRTAYRASVALSCYVKTVYDGLPEAIAELRGSKKLGMAGIRAMAHATGLTNIPLLIWELTPWSFAVDWVLHLQNFVQRMGPVQIPGRYIVERESSSQTTRMDFDRMYGNYVPSFTYGTPPVTRPNQWYKVGSGYTSRYVRSPSLPISSVSPSGLTDGQTMLLAALLQQQLR